MSGTRGYALARYVVGNHEAESLELETYPDQWMAIWEQRGETLPAGAPFVFEIVPDMETIHVRCRVIPRAENTPDRQVWIDVRNAIEQIGRPELTDDALIRDLLGPGSIYVRIGKLLEREDPA